MLIYKQELPNKTLMEKGRARQNRHGGAVGIEWLLTWTYRDQKADRVSLAGADCFVGNYDSCRAVAENARRGCRVDASPAGTPKAGWLDPDAMAVHEAVMRLRLIERGIVVMHARAGSRPDWMPDAHPRLVAVRRADGRPRMEYENGRPVCCLVRVSPLPEHIDFMREGWLVWWDILDGLRRDLDGALTCRVLPLDVPRAPWLTAAHENPLDGAKII